MAHATFRERPPRTNAPMQPRNGEKKMELVECQTCGSHSITNGKCDYCGNQYNIEPTWDEILEQQEQGKILWSGEPNKKTNEINFPEPDFQETQAGKTLLKITVYTLISIIWFAVTVFIPPLSIITIILLVVYGAYRLTKISK